MLTTKDLEMIRGIIKEEVSDRINTLSDQILEYTDSVRDAHDEWLRDHEERIKKLENHSFTS